jgi:phosphatidylglycerol:prolipoprotein diacylglycerol transferase
VYPELFSIGPFTVYSFGVLMALGFYVGTMISVAEYKRRGFDGEDLWGVLLWGFMSGLLSSKILSVLNNLDLFMIDPLGTVFAGSGFVWYGGLIGGFGVSWLLVRWRRMDFSVIVDCCAIGIPIGHAIGRLGCHIAGDGDWGTVTDVPWGVAYTNAIVGWDIPEGIKVHPTPIYEALAYASIGLLLFTMRKKELPQGTLFALYIVMSSLARVLVEFIRVNPKVAIGLTEAQLVAIALVAGAGVWLARHWTAPAPEGETAG